MNTLGTTVRRLRQRQGLTHKQLGEKASVAWHWIRQLEQGKLAQADQHLVKLRAVAAALGYSFAGLLREAGMIEPNTEVLDGDPGLRELVANLNTLTPDERQTVEDLIRTIVRGKTMKGG